MERREVVVRPRIRREPSVDLLDFLSRRRRRRSISVREIDEATGDATVFPFFSFFMIVVTKMLQECLTCCSLVCWFTGQQSIASQLEAQIRQNRENQLINYFPLARLLASSEGDEQMIEKAENCQLRQHTERCSEEKGAETLPTFLKVAPNFAPDLSWEKG